MRKILAAIEAIHTFGTKPLKQRFEEKFYRGKPDKCWIWKGAISRQPPLQYGYIMVEKKCILAHRLSWFFANGPIPEGMCMLHKCDNTRCVNPNHLFLGTRKDNNRDMVIKGRNVSHYSLTPGSFHPNAKLKEQQILEIRKLFQGGISQAQLARRFGISTSSMWSIVHKKTWLHI